MWVPNPPPTLGSAGLCHKLGSTFGVGQSHRSLTLNSGVLSMPPSTLQTPRSAWHCSLQVLCPLGAQGYSGDTLKDSWPPTNESLMAMDAGSSPGMPLPFSFTSPPKSPKSLPLSSDTPCPALQGVSFIRKTGLCCFTLVVPLHLPGSRPILPSGSILTPSLPEQDALQIPLPEAGSQVSPYLAPSWASSPLKSRESLPPLPPSSFPLLSRRDSHHDGRGHWVSSASWFPWFSVTSLHHLCPLPARVIAAPGPPSCWDLCSVLFWWWVRWESPPGADPCLPLRRSLLGSLHSRALLSPGPVVPSHHSSRGSRPGLPLHYARGPPTWKWSFEDEYPWSHGLTPTLSADSPPFIYNTPIWSVRQGFTKSSTLRVSRHLLNELCLLPASAAPGPTQEIQRDASLVPSTLLFPAYSISMLCVLVCVYSPMCVNFPIRTLWSFACMLSRSVVSYSLRPHGL